MEQRPSDSQNESANELPQSVPQPTPVAPAPADEPAAPRRSEDGAVSPGTSNQIVIDQTTDKPSVADRAVADPATRERVRDDQPATTNSTVESDREPVVDKQITNAPGRRLSIEPPTAETTSQPGQDQLQRESRSVTGQNESEPVDQSIQEQSIRDGSLPTEPTGLGQPNQPVVRQPDQERLRPDGQPRQRSPEQSANQPAKQVPNEERSGNEKPGHERPGEANQPRQQNNQSGQEKLGNERSERQPRDPNQPQKQGQDRSGNERPGHERQRGEKPGQPNQPRRQNGQPSGHERSGQERTSNEQLGSDKPGQEKGRDANQPQKQNQPRVNNQPPRQNQPVVRADPDRPGQDRPPREPKPARNVEIDMREDEDYQADTRQPERVPTGPREETTRESDNRLIIGITLGDYNGIGPEVILKALQYNRLQKICTPVIYGSMRVLNRYRSLLEMKDWTLNGIQQVGQASHKLTNIITCWPDQNQEIQPGKVTPEAGQAAFACLERAVEDLREGQLDAIVTAPINKHNIQSEEFKFPGHTEYLADAFSVADNLMFLVSERLRVGVVTGHVPLGRVRQNITRERILQKLTMMSQSLRLDFGIDKPRIAVLGLNPHAGEEGLLGNEEQEIVKPLIKQLQDKGNLVYGPFPADGFFGTRAYLKFDAVLAMYHDQGLIPFKAIAFEDGVNFTAAMPVVRTSPDHGTAYDIAGKNLADETSMLQAIYTACDIARRRRETAEINAGALKPKRERERAVEK